MVHNEYGALSGEEVIVARMVQLLRDHGHQVAMLTRCSADIHGLTGKTRALFSGIYSFRSRGEMKRLLAGAERPDIVHVHNLYPQLSPSILLECRSSQVPVVMTVHNSRLMCPNGLLFRAGHICQECRGGREYRCLLRNCMGSVTKSFGYSLRGMVARTWRMYRDNVWMYLALTDFQRRLMVAEGYCGERIAVLPHFGPDSPVISRPSPGGSIAFVGRISPEKGFGHFLELAKRHPDIPFVAAGAYDHAPQLARQVPSNLQLLGHVAGPRLAEVYANARMLVVASVWYEAFGLVILEAMKQGVPVVCSRIGGLAEIVENGQTGLLFEPGNAQDLDEKAMQLWSNPTLCAQLGEAARVKAATEYSAQRYYDRLMALYERTISLGAPSKDMEAAI